MAQSLPLSGQQLLPLPRRKVRWGGRREGAGRKPSGRARGLPHRPRPWHDRDQPVHVTLRVRRAVGSLRRHDVAAEILASFCSAASDPSRTATFRLIHFSIQPDHLHLIVEGNGKVALGRGLQGLTSRLARRSNSRLGRRGPVFADRFGRSLATPSEVRNATVHVLTNAAKHAEPIPDRGTTPIRGLDPCSSAHWFHGWDVAAPPQQAASPVATPRTWLLRVGWRRHGAIARTSMPASARRRAGP
jgi:REP element-mobilizing transposase RayT